MAKKLSKEGMNRLFTATKPKRVDTKDPKWKSKLTKELLVDQNASSRLITKMEPPESGNLVMGELDGILEEAGKREQLLADYGAELSEQEKRNAELLVERLKNILNNPAFKEQIMKQSRTSAGRVLARGIMRSMGKILLMQKNILGPTEQLETVEKTFVDLYSNVVEKRKKRGN
jgi:hypothetical protein